MGMNEITLDAYSKINLALDVTGKRDDGYHLVKMVMQTVGIHDRVTLRKVDGQSENISLTCSNPKVPLGESNIAWKACKKVIQAKGLNAKVGIHIEKNIPMAAGMAGGSTDAAAVILGMNELFELGMSQEEMDDIAVKLGADVPFCLRRGTYLSEGIGEVLTKLEDAPECAVLVANPPFEVSTAKVYSSLDELKCAAHPDVDRLICTIKDKDIQSLAGAMGNILELVTEPQYEIITQIKEKMLELGCLGSMMTGSGPTVFGLFEDASKAQLAFEYFKGKPELGKSFLTEFIRQEK